MKNLKKLFVFLTTGTMAVVLAACYGVPVDEMYQQIVRAKDNTGKAIKGLEVSVNLSPNDSITAKTDSLGEAFFNFYIEDNPTKLTIRDIDGIENGGEFETVEQEFDKNQETVDITMNKKAE